MSLLERGDKAYLLLADGTIFEGLHLVSKELQSVRSYLQRV